MKRRDSLRIVASTYRGRPGWTLCGRLPRKGGYGGHCIRVFDVDRAVLEAARRAYRELDHPEAGERVDRLLRREEKP